MKAFIGNALLANLNPPDKEYDIWDTKLTGFIIRVYPTGNIVYRCEYGRGKRATIGKASVLTPAQARDRAKEILADAVKGIDPNASKKSTKSINLQNYILNEYRPWVEANRKRGKETIARIKSNFFKEFGKKPLVEITPWIIEKWRTRRLQNGTKAATINRDIIALKAALSRAVEWELLKAHPLAKLKPSKIDSIAKIRYLSKDEEVALRKAMDTREERIRVARDNANEWRKERDYEKLPDLRNQVFTDHMKPMILVSLNTGLRRGELLNLTWDNVNLTSGILSVVGATAKSGKTRHVPINSEALIVLKAWQQQTSSTGLVFPGREGKQLTHVKRSWAGILKTANIENFRWHDKRHHFASKLVMAGVDLNTVRELLGHSDIKMTLRYAHLAPEHRAQAVEKLVSTYQ